MDVPPPLRIAELLQPYIDGSLLTGTMLGQLGTYVELLVRWNAHTNLTAVREPEALVQRQIGESLFALNLLPETGTLLDFGSGAGFPGIPIQIARPGLRVTLAESQGKKASFLREAVRSLDLPCEVWPRRVELMPTGRTFDLVTLRAVDGTEAVLPEAEQRVAEGGSLLRYVPYMTNLEKGRWMVADDLPVPLGMGRLVRLTRV